MVYIKIQCQSNISTVCMYVKTMYVLSSNKIKIQQFQINFQNFSEIC